MRVTPTCDAAFLDAGYHLGRAQMAAFAGGGALLANARSMLLQAIDTDLDADLRTVGYTEGMEAYRVRAAADGAYVGSALVVLAYPSFAWNEEVRVTVAGDVARFEERWTMGRANPYEARREP